MHYNTRQEQLYSLLFQTEGYFGLLKFGCLIELLCRELNQQTNKYETYINRFINKPDLTVHKSLERYVS